MGTIVLPGTNVAAEVGAAAGPPDDADGATVGDGVAVARLGDAPGGALWPAPSDGLELARATEDEKQSQLVRLRDFQARHRDESERDLQRLQVAAMRGENVFDVLMDAVRTCSLGQISEAFFKVGGQYRRNV